MKKLNFFGIVMIVAAVALLSITGCKKNDSTVLSDYTDEQTVNAADAERMVTITDDVADEANGLSLNYKQTRGVNYQGIITGVYTPCNAVVDTSLINIGKITVTYNGLSCNSHFICSGSIVFQLPYNTGLVTPWSDAGCMLTITYNNYQVTRVSDSKSLTLNGTKYITNVNGGMVDDATNFVTPLVHHITGMLQLTFDNGAIRTWNIDRTRTIARSNNVTSVTTVGNANENGFSNVSEWGINRKGNTFTITINTPVVRSSDCNFNGMSGVRTHHGVIRELTMTYGVDANGNAVTSGCPYGYKLDWTNKNGVNKEIVIAY